MLCLENERTEGFVINELKQTEHDQTYPKLPKRTESNLTYETLALGVALAVKLLRSECLDR